MRNVDFQKFINKAIDRGIDISKVKIYYNRDQRHLIINRLSNEMWRGKPDELMAYYFLYLPGGRVSPQDAPLHFLLSDRDVTRIKCSRRGMVSVHTEDRD